MLTPFWKAVLIVPLALLMLVLETVEWGCRKAAAWIEHRINRWLGQ